MTSDDTTSPSPTFEDLVTSRRKWIEEELRPWCQSASRKQLIKAEHEWEDIAGRAAAEQTLWTWAWERFPSLVYEGLTGVNETQRIAVELSDGETMIGFPDGRRSQRGELFLLTGENDMKEASTSKLAEAGPFSLDDIVSVNAVAD